MKGIFVAATVAVLAAGMHSDTEARVVLRASTSSSGSLQPMSEDDQRLAAKVEETLRMDHRINWQLLEVKAEEGKVQLYGVVKTPEEQGLATRIVASQPGVSAVDNRIVVDPSSPDTEKKQDLKEDQRPRVLEGEGQIKDQQILP